MRANLRKRWLAFYDNPLTDSLAIRINVRGQAPASGTLDRVGCEGQVGKSIVVEASCLWTEESFYFPSVLTTYVLPISQSSFTVLSSFYCCSSFATSKQFSLDWTGTRLYLPGALASTAAATTVKWVRLVSAVYQSLEAYDKQAQGRMPTRQREGGS